MCEWFGEVEGGHEWRYRVLAPGPDWYPVVRDPSDHTHPLRTPVWTPLMLCLSLYLMTPPPLPLCPC